MLVGSAESVHLNLPDPLNTALVSQALQLRVHLTLGDPF